MDLDLSGYTSNLEESEEKLIEIGNIIDQTSEVLQKASDDLRLIESRQETATKTFQESADSFLESLTQFATNTEARLDDVNRVKEGIESYAESSNSKLSGTIELASILITSTQQELSNQEETFTTALTELSEIISQFLGDANLSIESANSEVALFTEGTSQLSSKVTEVNDTLTTLTDRIASLFDDLTSNFLDSLKSSTESIYASAFSALSEQQTASIEETLAGVSSQLEDLLENFSESCTTVGDELMENVGNLLIECTEDISGNIQEKLQAAFEDAIENMLAEILKELGATVATMTLGSSVTGVMYPLIPAMKTVGEVLETLNTALDFFD